MCTFCLFPAIPHVRRIRQKSEGGRAPTGIEECLPLTVAHTVGTPTCQTMTGDTQDLYCGTDPTAARVHCLRLHARYGSQLGSAFSVAIHLSLCLVLSPIPLVKLPYSFPVPQDRTVRGLCPGFRQAAKRETHKRSQAGRRASAVASIEGKVDAVSCRVHTLLAFLGP